MMVEHRPRPISARAHRRFDMLALPNLLAFAAWMARRNHRAAALLLVDAAMEASALLTTDYPPPVLLPWLSFQDHNRIAAVHGACAAGMALVVPNIPARDRGVLLAAAAVPVALGLLSDTSASDSPQQQA
jgi:hypothetical protein